MIDLSQRNSPWWFLDFARKEWLHIDKDYRLALTEAILNDNVDRDFGKARKAFVFQGNDSLIDDFIERYGYDVFYRCVELNRNQYKKRKRVTDKTKSIILHGECLFLTLTFNDATLANTSPQTRRRYVARWLKSVSDTYVANIDFGDPIKHTGREHYHALIFGKHIDYTGWHKYGAIKGERVRTSEDDVKRTAKYVVKLARHAQKESAGKTVRLIYSRNSGIPPSWLFE